MPHSGPKSGKENLNLSHEFFPRWYLVVLRNLRAFEEDLLIQGLISCG